MESKITTESKIIVERLDELIKVVDQLPYPSNIRTLIKYNAANDFYDSWQFNDKINKFSFRKFMSDRDNDAFRDCEITKGITNFEQLNRYFFEFIGLLQQVRLRSLEDIFFPTNYPQVEFSKEPLGINHTEVSRFTFLWNYQLNFLSGDDVNSQLSKIIGPKYDQLKHQNSLSRASHLPDQININKILIERSNGSSYGGRT